MSELTRYADLKNDFVFRRVFGKNPELMVVLLNDLLDRDGPQAVIEIEYISAEHAPELDGAKPAMIDVKCRDASGGVFLVELQLLHVSRFMKRVIHNACKSYTQQIARGATYQDLLDVVAVTICDFELWTDEDQQARRSPRVPMLSRWKMTEAGSHADGPLHVQYVFLELPKLPSRTPLPGLELWAWLLRAGQDQVRPPESLEGPYLRAFELCNEATFTGAEMEAYRKVQDEIEQTRHVARDAEQRGKREGLMEGRQEGRVEGKREGLLEGETKGRRSAVRAVLLRWIEKQGLACSDADRSRIEAETSVEVLERWADRVVGASDLDTVFGEDESLR
jgi:predicted transposase/invertase (TIGR01784 family)